MKKTTLENLKELRIKLPSFHSRHDIVKIQQFNSYIEDHIYQQDEKLIDKKYNQYLDSLECYFNEFFNFYKHNDDYDKTFNKILFLIDTFIENETFLEEKLKPLEQNLSDLNKSYSEEIKISYVEHGFKIINENFKEVDEHNKLLKEKVSSLEERIKKLENKISINDYLGPNRIGGKPYHPYPLPQPTIPYTPVTPYYTLCTSTGEINKKEN
jgi:hypothetical protein